MGIGVSRNCWRMRDTPLGIAASPDCTAIGNSGHCLNQDCDTIQSHRKEPPMAVHAFGKELKPTTG